MNLPLETRGERESPRNEAGKRWSERKRKGRVESLWVFIEGNSRAKQGTTLLFNWGNTLRN